MAPSTLCAPPHIPPPHTTPRQHQGLLQQQTTLVPSGSARQRRTWISPQPLTTYLTACIGVWPRPAWSPPPPAATAQDNLRVGSPQQTTAAATSRSHAPHVPPAAGSVPPASGHKPTVLSRTLKCRAVGCGAHSDERHKDGRPRTSQWAAPQLPVPAPSRCTPRRRLTRGSTRPQVQAPLRRLPRL